MYDGYVCIVFCCHDFACETKEILRRERQKKNIFNFFLGENEVEPVYKWELFMYNKGVVVRSRENRDSKREVRKFKREALYNTSR